MITYAFNGSTFVNALNIKSDGNVGIGTASPATELEVKAGSGYAELRLQGASGSSGAVEGFIMQLLKQVIYI